MLKSTQTSLSAYHPFVTKKAVLTFIREAYYTSEPSGWSGGST
jgi:hypothetical protein